MLLKSNFRMFYQASFDLELHFWSLLINHNWLLMKNQLFDYLSNNKLNSFIRFISNVDNIFYMNFNFLIVFDFRMFYQASFWLEWQSTEGTSERFQRSIWRRYSNPMYSSFMFFQFNSSKILSTQITGHFYMNIINVTPLY